MKTPADEAFEWWWSHVHGPRPVLVPGMTLQELDDYLLSYARAAFFEGVVHGLKSVPR